MDPGNRQDYDFNTPSTLSTPMSSSPGDGMPQASNHAGSRKRSFGTSQLGLGAFSQPENKSRRASPNPAFGASLFDDDDDDVIDLTA